MLSLWFGLDLNPLHVLFQLFFKEMCCMIPKSLQVVHLIDNFWNTYSGWQGCIHFTHYSHYMPYSLFITYVNYIKCTPYFADSFQREQVSFNFEQEPSSSDRQHFLDYGIQAWDRDTCKEGCTNYRYYTFYFQTDQLYHVF